MSAHDVDDGTGKSCTCHLLPGDESSPEAKFTVIAVLSSARAMSYVGECIVKVAHHYVEEGHAKGSLEDDKQALISAPRGKQGIRL